MKNVQRFVRGNPYVSTTLSVLASVLAVSGIVYAATTIGTNVSVDGTLTVTGASTFTGAATFSGGTTNTGLTSFAQASSTLFSVPGTAYFGGSATSTFDSSGNLSVAGTLTQTGAATFNGNNTFGNASTDTNLFTGTLQASTTALFTTGLTSYSTASTSALVVGGPTTLNTLVAGFCNIPDTTVAASSTAYANCTSATGIEVGYRVFVMATGSLQSSVVVKAASSTNGNIINVALQNVTNVSTTTDNISFNFFGIR